MRLPNGLRETRGALIEQRRSFMILVCSFMIFNHTEIV